MDLHVSIEINGIQHEVGTISGLDSSDACFSYSEEYLNMPGSRPVSLSLPLVKETYSPKETRCYFEGLLPEGFTRRTIAQRMHYNENDYISILYGLGHECIGAIRVFDRSEMSSCSYEHIDKEQIEALAAEGASASADIIAKTHLSLAGATGKVGLYYDKENDIWYLPHGIAPSTHIVKQSHVRLDNIVLNEQISLLTASRCDIETPHSFIINTTGKDDENVLLAVERYDRFFPDDQNVSNDFRIPYRLHQEDFAQAMGIPSENKYENDDRRGYAHGMFDIIRKYCTDPIDDQTKLLDRLIFNYILGNTDSHIKNHSLIYNESLSAIRLAPAYDMICTTIYESSTRELSVSIGDSHTIDSVTVDSFRQLSGEIGLTEKTVIDRYERMLDLFEKALITSADELSEQGFVNAKKVAERILMSRKKVV